MPNKNIYVSEPDLSLFEEAQKLAGGNLSWAIAKALRRYVEEERTKPGDFEEVVVKVNQDGFFAKKRFRGHLLTQVRLREERENGARVLTYNVYTTPKKKWAVFVKDVPSWWYSPGELNKQSRRSWMEWDERGLANHDYYYRLDVYESEEEMQAHLPARVYSAVCLALTGEGGDVEELDL